MERLDITLAPELPNIETAIHFARYAIAKDIVVGKRVLDIACGEGYGSYLLKQAGAAHVVGVDVSAESVSKASRFFGGDGIEFATADAANLDSLFPDSDFDVVISIETIEHLPDPLSFLKSLKRMAKTDGVIVLSCPNDYWYYPEDDRANPYHRRKYTLEDFQSLSVEVLGNNVKWSVGTGVFGFGSTPLSAKENYSRIPGSWMSYMNIGASYLVSGEEELATSASQCSYYVGVWNAPDWMNGIAVFPLSMDDYASKVVSSTVQAQFHAMHSKLQTESEAVRVSLEQSIKNWQVSESELRRQGLLLQASKAECDALREALIFAKAEQSKLPLVEREVRRQGLLLQASKAECDALREALIFAKAECDIFRIGYFRYMRISKFIPKALRSFAVKIVRFVRAGKCR